MKNFIFFGLIILLFLSLSCVNPKKIACVQRQYLPKVVSNLYIGMPEKKLKKIRGIGHLAVTKNSNLTIIKEELKNDSIPIIQYQFGKDKKLYEIIVEYSPEISAFDIFKNGLGEPNNGNEWQFFLNNNLILKIWIYQNRLCIADNKHFSK